ncbi:MAG: hypothetical protein QNJ63_10095 [Calothrix sp. MO_192.B10]|nr:hypothetical protein [Calothrix sp. MO_192.B10]
MSNIKLENLDNSPIDFDLSEEDLTSIKGGMNSPFQLKYKEYFDDKIIIIKIECYCPDEDWLKPPLLEP